MPARKKPTRSVFDAATANRAHVAARYDVARTDGENVNLWRDTDGLSAASANTPAVRKTIRERARYEVANNSYADGIIDTLSNDIVGSEVQLQLGDSTAAQKAEDAFAEWAAAVRLWHLCRVATRAKKVDGEVFALLTTRRALPTAVKLSLRLIECEMVESAPMRRGKADELDGIRFDGDGFPAAYRILKQHPGDHRWPARGGFGAGDWEKAQYVAHYFSPTRPGQVRGVSEILPALSLFGELRLYTKAVRNSATRAAEIAVIMHTDLTPESLAAELTDPVTTLEMPRNAIMSVPEGWEPTQLKAEQPITSHEQFTRTILKEIARCVNMPHNIAACDSSDYNYASGRLDHQTYERSIIVERADLRAMLLDPIYAAWLSEYASQEALSAADMRELSTHEWHFSARDHVDPAKEANADNIRLRNGTLTKAAYYAKRGLDWKRQEEQRVRELVDSEVMWNAAREAAGLPPAPYPHTDNSAPAAAPEGDDDDRDE